MKSVYSDLGPEDLDALLANGSITEDLGEPGWDDIFGYGLIDAVQAVDQSAMLAGGGDLPSVLTTTPSLLIFESGVSVLTLEVAQVGSDPLTVTKIEPSDPSDDWVLATALSSQATLIITGDDDLLSLGSFAGVEIVTPRQFLERYISDEDAP